MLQVSGDNTATFGDEYFQRQTCQINSNDSLACVRHMSQITYYYEVNREIRSNKQPIPAEYIRPYIAHANNDDRIRHTPLRITRVYVRVRIRRSRGTDACTLTCVSPAINARNQLASLCSRSLAHSQKNLAGISRIYPRTPAYLTDPRCDKTRAEISRNDRNRNAIQLSKFRRPSLRTFANNEIFNFLNFARERRRMAV